MRGRRANKPVMVQREGEREARSRTKNMEMVEGGNEVESDAAVPPGPNQDRPACVHFAAWTWTCACVTICVLFVWVFMITCYVCARVGTKCDCAPMWQPGAIFSFVRVHVCRLSSGSSLTTQPTDDYTALVLSSLYSVLHLLSAREPAQN